VRTGIAAPIETALVPQAARTPDPSRPFLPFPTQTKDADVHPDQSVFNHGEHGVRGEKDFVILSDGEESEFTNMISLAFARDDIEDCSANSVFSGLNPFLNPRQQTREDRNPNPLSFLSISQATRFKNDERSICFSYYPFAGMTSME
jgi:hypothetical protein